MDTFPVVIIPDNVFRFMEQVGTKPKFWYVDADPSETSFKDEILFKEARPQTGEDWAEKIVSELCTVLGLPHAPYVWRSGRSVQGSLAGPSYPKTAAWNSGMNY